MPDLQPALRIPGARFSTPGYYGTSDYGTSPYGGEQFDATFVVSLRGSDCLSETRHRVSAEVVHERLGIPVAWRQWAEFKRWSVSTLVYGDAALAELRELWAARQLELLPDGSGGPIYNVLWTDTEFRAEQIRPGLYQLSFTLQEIPA